MGKHSAHTWHRGRLSYGVRVPRRVLPPTQAMLYAKFLDQPVPMPIVFRAPLRDIVWAEAKTARQRRLLRMDFNRLLANRRDIWVADSVECVGEWFNRFLSLVCPPPRLETNGIIACLIHSDSPLPNLAVYLSQ